jgi:hypothetical protein
MLVDLADPLVFERMARKELEAATGTPIKKARLVYKDE